MTKTLAKSFDQGMEIPWTELQPETLQVLIEEFVTRSGTDYGRLELSLATKVQQVHRLLQEKKAIIVFDPETESCDIRESHSH